jgi:hypothetical protein
MPKQSPIPWGPKDIGAKELGGQKTSVKCWTKYSFKGNQTFIYAQGRTLTCSSCCRPLDSLVLLHLLQFIPRDRWTSKWILVKRRMRHARQGMRAPSINVRTFIGFFFSVSKILRQYLAISLMNIRDVYIVVCAKDMSAWTSPKCPIITEIVVKTLGKKYSSYKFMKAMYFRVYHILECIKTCCI